MANEHLIRDVLSYANRVHTFFEQQKRSDLAERIANEAKRWNEDEVAVIVAGEMKRGKSSLLNALIGTRDSFRSMPTSPPRYTS